MKHKEALKTIQRLEGKTKVAVFTRVSSKSDRQSNDRQINDLCEYALQRNWNTVKVFKEKISGSKKMKDRPQLQKLFSMAENGKIEKVLISELSRFGRSMLDVLSNIETMTKLGVSIYIKDMGMETLNEKGKPTSGSKILLAVMAAAAEMERDILIERTKSGLKAARAKGRFGGRPKGVTETNKDTLKKYPKVIKELKKGTSLRNTAKLCDVSVNTVRKVKEAMQLDL